MSDLLLALFIGDKYKEYKLSSIHSNQFIADLEQYLQIGSINYSDLFIEKNKKWIINKVGQKHISLSCNRQEIREKVLEHGDFYIVHDAEHDVHFEFLITSLENENIAFTKHRLEKNKNIFIGRSPDNEINFDINTSVSRKHAAIRFENERAFVEDVSRKTGVFINGERVQSAELFYGDIIYIMGLKMVYFDEFLAINDVIKKCSLPGFTQFAYTKPKKQVQSEKYFTRSPRIIKSLETSEFVIDPPPEMQSRQDLPLVFTIGPSLTMAIAMLVSLGITISNANNGSSVWTSATMAVSMLIGALVWPVALNRYQKRQEAKIENHRIKKYREYIYKKKLELEEKKQRNIKILTEKMFPDPITIIKFLNSEETIRRLWEKTPNNADFLELRLGKGNREFDVNVITSKKGFTLHDDPLADEPIKLADEYKMLDHVPITVSLKEQKLIGLIGNRRNIINNANCLALNLAGQHSYDEVKMVFIYNERDAKDFKWVRELPHVWSPDRTLRFVATNKEEVHQLFSALNEDMKERELQLKDSNKEESIPLPKYVFFLADDRLVENEPLMRYLTNPDNPVDVTSLFIYGQISMLPKDCSAIIQNDSNLCGVYFKNKHFNRLVEFQQDEIDQESLLMFSQKLSKLKIKTDSISLDVPESVSFLGMLKAGSIEELNMEQLWNKKVSYKSLEVPIGIKAGGELFSLDIHENYHGPHGLVAGMTGSGKSEFLQTYIISAAVNYHPNDLSFVLIDYKGGGMANVFDGIPHIAGKITNLSGSQLSRSLISIEAEIKRRQYLFNQYGINHVDKYQKLFKEGIAIHPLPHLVIISDEFAQLKTQQPDFMRKLIDVAQIGRSLGIHLILATQKPAGVVDDQIWGNSRFRVCLKVLDKHDSNEMIRKPDAALIKQPGRCYVQVGYDEIYEYVQSGYSGGQYAPTDGYIDPNEQTVHYVDNTAVPIRKAKNELAARNTDNSQLEAIIKKLIDMKKIHNIASISLWLDPLEEVISLSELKGYYEFNRQWSGRNGELSAIIGLADFPGKQEQNPVEIDLMNDGHVVIYGSSGTGKTTFLQSLLFSFASKYSPGQLNMYVFDFAGRSLGYFSNMPHCEEVIYANDEEKVEQVLEDVLVIMEERKVLFSENNVGSFASYVSHSKNKLPAIMIVIDNYSTFRDRFFPQEDKLISLVANGKTYGIFFVITGNSKNAVFYKVTEHVSNFFTLQLNDSLDYREILGKTVSVAPDNVRGRGLTVIGEVAEFQTALVIPAENEAERVIYIQRKFEEMSAAAGDSFSKARTKKSQSDVTPVKKQLSASATNRHSGSSSMKNNLEVIEPGEHALYAGNLLKRNKSIGIPLEELHTFFIGGFQKTGKTNYLKFMLRSIKEYSSQLVTLIDRDDYELEDFAREQTINRYISSSDEFDSYVKELEERVKERLQVYNNFKKNTDSKEGICEYMQKFEKLFICINGFSNFFDMISDDALEMFTNIAAKSKGLNIYFITLDDLESVRNYSNTELFRYLIKARHGIIMGGNMHKQGIIVIEDMGYLDRELELKNGEGVLFNGNKYAVVRNPLMKLEVVG
ncbi:type VII secretion protein EssC [Cytobacillus firmus]|uniref:type VII secretion protein EssC n=1 Tax=Cytobacillus firmus TaxID=1399 RepID=UPI0021617C7A|nr:type VII secretion protein EssC [Cytobacillus firmus]MCS0674494.1 type VII secretion protein EssC [Cytobacillus firmus]